MEAFSYFSQCELGVVSGGETHSLRCGVGQSKPNYHETLQVRWSGGKIGTYRLIILLFDRHSVQQVVY